jgi:hypothetical protein
MTSGEAEVPLLRDRSMAMLLTCILAASNVTAAFAATAPTEPAPAASAKETLDPGPPAGAEARGITRDDVVHGALGAAAIAALVALLAGHGHGSTATTTATATSTSTSN